jgi:hypothetical protein
LNKAAISELWTGNGFLLRVHSGSIWAYKKEIGGIGARICGEVGMTK